MPRRRVRIAVVENAVRDVLGAPQLALAPTIVTPDGIRVRVTPISGHSVGRSSSTGWLSGGEPSKRVFGRVSISGGGTVRATGYATHARLRWHPNVVIPMGTASFGVLMAEAFVPGDAVARVVGFSVGALLGLRQSQ
jgi:hypothetical protein